MALADTPVHKKLWSRLRESGGEFHLVYWPRVDLFAKTFGTLGDAISVELNDGIVLRVDTTSNEIIGIEIYDYQRLFRQRHPELPDAFESFQHTWTFADRVRQRIGWSIDHKIRVRPETANDREGGAALDLATTLCLS